MKKVYYILIFMLLGGLFNCSSKEEFSNLDLESINRDTICVGFSFYSAAESVVVSKAPLKIDATTINNLNIYIFNENGDILSHKYIEGETKVDGLVVYNNMSYKVYVVANTGVSLPCTTIEQLEALTIKIESIDELVTGTGAILMSGTSGVTNLSDGADIDIGLARCVSKLSLAFNYTELNSNVSITIKRAQLFNAPNSIKLFGNNIAENGNVIAGELYNESDLASFSSANGSNSSNNNSIPFYLFENMQGVVAQGSLDNKSKEQQMSSEAKESSSYIELEYDYLSPEKQGTIIYRFYIGETHADCNIIRNTNYLCNIYFKRDGSANENSWSVDNTALVDLVTAINLTPTEYEFSLLADTLQIDATILPLTANNKTLNWSSSNSLIASVSSSGLVTSISDGNAVITAKSCDGTAISAMCNIIVDSRIAVESVTVEPTSVTIYEGDSNTIVATLLPQDATDPTIEWSSTNNSVAIVDSVGKVTAISVGEVNIIASSRDNPAIYGICKVYVAKKELEVSPLKSTLYVGESFNFNFKVTPPVTPLFVSSAPAIASVDKNGKVVALSEGVAEISISAHNLTEVCSVTVIQPILEFGNSGMELYPEEEAFIPFAKLVPNNELPNVILSLDGIVEVLDITSKGITVRGISVGTTILTASTHGVSDTYSINVVPLEVEIYAISAQYDASTLLDTEYCNEIESKNVYGVRPVRNNANIEFVTYTWSTKAINDLQIASEILRVTNSEEAEFIAQATKLTTNTSRQRGLLNIKVSVTTKGGTECIDNQSLQVYEYAPLYLYWKDGNDTQYEGNVEGLVYVMLTTNKMDPDPKFVYSSITASTVGVNTIPFNIVCQRASEGVYLDEPWSRIDGDKIIAPKNYIEYVNYFSGVEVRLWDYGNSLYYCYEGNILNTAM